VIADAGVDGITSIVGFDPSSGMHLDDDSGSGGKPSARKMKGPAVPIGIMLKSDPPKANISVDGEYLGTTPKYWSGVADGTEHEFAFTKDNYALAHYRFVPVASGVLHATLVRVSSGAALDAGLDPIIAPTQAPDAAIAPPPTVLPPRPTPDAAAVEAPSVDAVPSEPMGPQP
jgi:hypothetical protein